MKKRRLERFIEFLLIGVMLGLVEDLLAIYLATDTEFSLEMIPIVLAVAIPFAAFSELVVDKEEFRFPEKLVSKIKNRL